MAEDAHPATKQDLNELREEMHQFRGEIREEMHGLRDQLRQEMHELGDRLVEQMRDMQTEVLRAFHDWASPVEIKLRAIPALDQRLGLIEERLSRLERGRLQH